MAHDPYDVTSVRNNMRVAKPILFWSLVAFGISVAVTLALLALKPTFLSMEREAYQNSHQYVDAHATAINKLVTSITQTETKIAKYTAEMKAGGADYTQVIEGLRAQKAAFINEINQKAATMPDGEIPSAALPYLTPGTAGR